MSYKPDIIPFISTSNRHDMLYGLPFNQTVNDATAQWYRNPTTNITTNATSHWWVVKTNVSGSNPNVSPDIDITFAADSSFNLAAVTRLFRPPVFSQNWKVSATLKISGLLASISDGSYARISIRDNNNPAFTIIMFDIRVTDIQINGTTFLTGTAAAVNAIISTPQTLTIEHIPVLNVPFPAGAGGFNVTYAGASHLIASAVDSFANVLSPGGLSTEINFQSSNYSKPININFSQISVN